jgi:hypothetical protein
MDERKTLKAMKITMRKHPESLKLEESLKEVLNKMDYSDNIILYDG